MPKEPGQKRSGKTRSAKERKEDTPVRGRRTFTEDFKREAVRRMRERRADGVPLSQIGRELDVRSGLLWEWARKLDDKGTGRVESFHAAPDGETLEDEVRRLRRENAVLKQEREFAKKAAAFFAKESR